MSSTAALIPGHYLHTISSPIREEAQCQCGLTLRWETRDADHVRHLLAVTWEQGALQANMSLTQADADLFNPWKD